MTGPLSGLRVLDCSSGTAGPRVGGLLADYGADVVWVERPGGDPLRSDLAAEYSVYNRGKRSVELDLTMGSRELDQLLEGADVLIHAWRPGVAERLHLDYESLHGRHRALVHCQISGFGLDGPHAPIPGYESVVHALVGTMAEQIGLREGPIYEALPFASVGAAYLAAIGTLAALYRRADDGIGRHVETSMLDGALAYLACFWGETDADGETRAGITSRDFLVGESLRLICGSFLCADGRYIGVHSGAIGGFGRLMSVLGLDDRVASDPNGLDVGIPLTAVEREILHGEIHQIFARDPVAVWEKRLRDADVCGIPVHEPGEVFDEPQAAVNDSVVEVDDPDLGWVQQAGPAIRFSRTPVAVTEPAPRLGSSSASEVAADWGAAQPRLWVGSDAAHNGPLLDGVRIVDLGVYFAGPYASRLLAELGADVIKVETTAGDPLRGLPALFRGAQANKRSIAMDLRHEGNRSVLDGLISWADIVHHNMRPGAAERLGVGYEQVRAKNPGVIYGYAPGWGSSGPLAGRQSFEPMMSGYVGVSSEVAGQFNPPLYPQGNADPGNGLVGAMAMLMALLYQRRTGDGQSYENTQLNATINHLAHIVRDAETKTVVNAGKLDPLQMGLHALDRLYETNNGWLLLAAVGPGDVARLVRALGPDIGEDPRFSTAQARAAHDYELAMAIGDSLSSMSTQHAIALLARAGVTAVEPVPYNNFVFMRDPENRRTGRVAERIHPRLGRVRELAQLVRVSDCAPVNHRLAPELGEHTDGIYRQFGYPDEHIDHLVQVGAARRFASNRKEEKAS